MTMTVSVGVRGDDGRLRQDPDPAQRHAHHPEQRPEPQLHPADSRRLQQHPPVPVDLRLPLAGRHHERRRLRRKQRHRVGLLRHAAAVEQQRDPGRAAGHRQRLGQHQRSGHHLHRRHDPADRERSLRRHHTAVRHGIQLRRRDELRHRVCPGDRLPGGRGLLRRADCPVAAAAPSPSRTSASTASPTTSSTSRRGGRCATRSSATTAAPRRTLPSRRRAAGRTSPPPTPAGPATRCSGPRSTAATGRARWTDAPAVRTASGPGPRRRPGGSSPSSESTPPAELQPAVEQPAAEPVERDDRGPAVGSLRRRAQLQHGERHSGAAVGLPRRHQPALDLHRQPAADGVRQQVPGRQRPGHQQRHRRRSSGTATVRPTSSGTSTPTAPSPASNQDCAWTPAATAPPTARRSTCGPATAAPTSNGPCATDLVTGARDVAWRRVARYVAWVRRQCGQRHRPTECLLRLPCR